MGTWHRNESLVSARTAGGIGPARAWLFGAGTLCNRFIISWSCLNIPRVFLHQLDCTDLMIVQGVCACPTPSLFIHLVSSFQFR